MKVNRFTKSIVTKSLFLLSLLVVSSCSSSSDDEGKPDGAVSDTGGDAVVGDGANDTKPPPPDLEPDKPAGPKPVIKELVPADGPANGGRSNGIRVTMVGENFGPNIAVYLDGGGAAIITTIKYTSSVSISFTMPKNPYGPPYDKPAKVSVQVTVDKQGSNLVDFQYWVPKPMDADFTAEVLTKTAMAYRDYASEPFVAKVYVKDVTDKGSTAPTDLIAQIGIGKEGEEPDKDYSFKWFDAKFVSDGDKFDPPQDAKYDIFSGQVTPPLKQKYDVAFRFSIDGGQSWVFVDAKEDDAYSPGDAAKLDVQDAPDGYCQTNDHCITDKYAATCKVDAMNWKANRCVQCLEDADCKSTKWALGPTCEAEYCTCATDDDCTGNPNGGGCVSSSYCGCESDDHCDWANGEKCVQDENTGQQYCAPEQ